MKRVKSIDMIRGFCIFLMLLYHTIDWWILVPDRWIIVILFSFLGSIGFSGFLFVSGFSAVTAYISNKKKTESSTGITMTQVRKLYMVRALLLLATAFLYNIVISLSVGDFRWLWAWNVLQTISVSLLLVWPLFRTPMYLRVGLVIGLLVLNDRLSPFLLSYEGQLNVYGVLFQILYHPIESYTIIPYFAMFIFGTVVGSFFFEFNIIKDQKERKEKIKSVFIKTIVLFGIASISFGIIFRFYEFLIRVTLSAFFYSMGMILFIFAVLLYLEEFEKIKPKKSYRFFFYLSYYSFTIYIVHNVLYPIFYQQLNVIIVWFAFIGEMILITLLLKVIYDKLGSKASLKAQLGILSLVIIKHVEQKKNKS